MITTLHFLNETGDLKLTWDTSSPADVERARKEVLELKGQGYSFFLVTGEPADEIAAGQGVLDCRRVDAEELLTGATASAAPAQEKTPAVEAQAEPRRGRKAVAVPQQRGG